MKILTLNDENIVVSEKTVGADYEVQPNEVISEVGRFGQRMLEDGTFVDVIVEALAPITPLDRQILIESKYQSMLLEELVDVLIYGGE